MPPLHAPVPLVGVTIHPLDEASAKQALSAHGVQVPLGGVVDAPLLGDRASQALSAATAIGWPVVLKAVASDLAHKTEQQAVHLNLRNADQLRAAADKLAGFDRWLVEEMVAGAVAELIVGVTRDPQFGTSLTIGAGGVMVELLADSVTLLLPTSASEVERALRRLKCFALLDGFRGRPRADLQAVVHSVLAIAAYAESQASRLIELDVNPLIVTANDAIAADALIRLASVD
jgi:succinyl-CoA synthetase beta subunit